MKYEDFSKEGEVMEFVDQKRIQQGCSSSTQHTAHIYLNIFTDGIIQHMSNDALRSTNNRRN
jgi:hypothetical protein